MESIAILLKEGGVTAWIILLAGVLLLVVGMERAYFLFFKYSIDVDLAIQKVRTFILKKSYTEAIQICNTVSDSPELNVAKMGLLAAEHGREAMRSALGGAVLEVTKNCERRISIIALIAGISTLLGLLGTISGLIKTFQALAQADPSKKGEILGLGISEAMYATAAGLVLGILAMVVHSVCVSKGEEIVGSAQDLGYKLVTWVEQSERGSVNE
jgi:biopolymer transport protein ExbB/TolQ